MVSKSTPILPPGFAAEFVKCTLIHLLLGVVVSFTHRSSLIRPAALVLIIAFAIQLQDTVTTWTDSQTVVAILPLFSCINVFTALDSLLYNQITFPDHLEWAKNKKNSTLKDTVWQRAKWALQFPINHRRIGTQWQAAGIPSFDPADPAYVPDRATFLLHRLLTTITAGIALIFTNYRLDDPGITALLAQPLTLDEYSLSLAALPSRLWLTLSFISTIFIAQKAQYNILSILAVGLHLSDPAGWPPLQGSLFDCWSIRQLWGTTWHQNFRRFLSANADFLTFSLLRLKPRTVTARYTRFFLCFFASGFIHLLFDEACGIPARKSGALLFFSIQPVAFAVEEIVQTVTGRYGFLGSNAELRRMIGFVWVGVWCVGTWPVWFFPATRELVRRGEGFSLIHMPVYTA